MSAVLPELLLVGGGRMGAALLAGWRERGLAGAVVVDPSPAAMALGGDGVVVVPEVALVPAGFRPACVTLAVKPQAAVVAVPPCARFGGALFISIMAGQTLAGIAGMVGADAALVRAMPNTPAAIGQGFTVAVAGAHVTGGQRDLADELLRAVGQVAWVDDEALLDPVTAISGGGPAYLFLLTELMERAALDHGIPPALARAMARQTVIGAAGLLAAGDEDAAALRVAVTSPGGTTERALAVLRAPDAWPGLFAAAISAATKRSRELSD
jgi:pyrroline-5-carboxylate reductase